MSAFLIRLLLEHLKIGTKSRMRLRTWLLGTRPPIGKLVSTIVMISFYSEKHFQMDKILQNNSHNVVIWEFYLLWTNQKQTNVMKLILCEFFHIQRNSERTVSELEKFCIWRCPKSFVDKYVLHKLAVCELYLELLKQAIFSVLIKTALKLWVKILNKNEGINLLLKLQDIDMLFLTLSKFITKHSVFRKF